MTKEQAVYAMHNRLPIIQDANVCSEEIEYERITGIMLEDTGQLTVRMKDKRSHNSVTFADIKSVRIKE